MGLSVLTVIGPHDSLASVAVCGSRLQQAANILLVRALKGGMS
jgi:hypothetical protein